MFTCFLFLTTSARADTIQWGFAWTRNPVSVPSDGNGTGGISLTLGQGLPMTGDSDITAINLSTFSSAPKGTIDHFTNAPFSLGLTLNDSSGQTGQTSFTGVFNGTLTPTSAQITASFDRMPHQLTIGSHLYTVALTSYAAPGIPDSTTFGSIGAHVSVVDASSGGPPAIGGGGAPGGGGGPGITDVPEPTSLLLAGLATPAIGLACWRRWRAGRLAPQAG
jgi:hypothetical protein